MAPHNSVVLILRRTEGDVPEVLLLRCLPNMHLAEVEPFYKLPGGSATGNETPEETGRREVREETGLKIRLGAPMTRFYAREFERHTKYGLWIWRSHCRGRLNKTPRNDRKTRILDRIWVSLDKAKLLITPGLRNNTQNEMLQILHESLMHQHA